MRIPFYQVDAFTNQVFKGNFAGVCILEKPLSPETMQLIAAENNLSETAFIVHQGDSTYQIRWFTPTTEVALCGHATLAAAHVLFYHTDYTPDYIEFQTMQRGSLHVHRTKGWLSMDFPADTLKKIPLPGQVTEALGIPPQAVFRGKDDLLAILGSQKEIETLRPSMEEVALLDARALIVSAPGTETDIVSRFFAPQSGIPEDPVTGSAHTTLAVYWCKKLGKNRITARQLSARTGDLICELHDDRVILLGQAVTYLEGYVMV